MSTVHVYILQCADGSFYVGLTEDLAWRVARHKGGTAAVWTTCRLPITLVYSEEFDDLESAVAREAQLKGWSRAKKVALISRNTAEAFEPLSELALTTATFQPA